MTVLSAADRKLLAIALMPDPELPAPGKGPRWRGLAADKVYCEAREDIIPHAERAANAAEGEAPQKGEERMAWGARWDRAFHAAMAELWEARGRAIERLFGKREQVFVEGLRVRYRFVAPADVPREASVVRDRKLIERQRALLAKELERLQASMATKERTVLVKEIVE